MTKALAKYDAMCRAIDAAYEVDEVKSVRDQAIALEYYSRQAHNVEAERRACEIRLRAERKAGQLLAKTSKRGGDRKSKHHRGALKPSDISAKQSDNWRALARVPDDQFEMSLATMDRPTTKGIIRAATKPKVTPVSSDALWLWGRLNDFARRKLLDQEPDDVLKTMTAEMLDDVHTLAPKVAAWLKRIGAIKCVVTAKENVA